MSSQGSHASSVIFVEPAKPRCGMDDLSAEIKARIVQLCAEQDDRFKVEVESVGLENGREGFEGSKTVRGRSIPALLQVSTEFSALAAPHLFKVLKAPKVDFTFKCLVRRRLNLFTELVFDDDNLKKLEDVVCILPELTQLRKLVLSPLSIDPLWRYRPVSLDPSSINDPFIQLVASAFDHLTKITEIRFILTPMTAVSAFTQQYSTLRILDVEFMAEEEGALTNARVGLLHLETLKITVTEDFGPVPIFDVDPILRDPRRRRNMFPPLRKLSISSFHIHANQVSFIEDFSPSLEELSISSTSPFGDFASGIGLAPPFCHDVFPMVKRLNLSGSYSHLKSLIQSVSPDAFPALQTVELDLHVVKDWESGDSPLQPFSCFPCLEPIVFTHLEHFRIDEVLAIEQYCARNYLSFEGKKGLVSRLLPAPDKDDTLFSWESVGTTISFLQEQADKGFDEGDWSGIKQFEGFLRRVEQERIRTRLWEAV